MFTFTNYFLRFITIITSSCLLIEQVHGHGYINIEPISKHVKLQKHLPSTPVLVGLLKIEGELQEDTSSYTIKLESLCKKNTIAAILVLIDSGGGSITGTYKLFETFTSCREKKPLVAFIPETGASAAYWLATHCDAIVASPLASIGSIGVIIRYLKENNITIHKHNLVSQLDYYFNQHQASINKTRSESLAEQLPTDYTIFIEMVARLKNLDLNMAPLWAEGKIFTGNQAFVLKLVDHLGSYITALQIIAQLISVKNKTEHKDLKPEQLLLTEEA